MTLNEFKATEFYKNFFNYHLNNYKFENEITNKHQVVQQMLESVYYRFYFADLLEGIQ